MGQQHITRTNIKVKLISLILLSIVSSPLAKTDPFELDHHFLHPVSLANPLNPDPLLLFQNPANLDQQTTKQWALLIHQKNWEYKQVHTAFLWPLKKWTLGLAYSRFGTSDLIEAKKIPRQKAQATGSFSDTLNTLEFSTVHKNNLFNAGVKISIYQRKLYKQQANSINLDLCGLIWLNPKIWISAYTRNLTAQAINWKESTVKEDKAQDIILESGFIYKNKNSLSISLNKDWLRNTLEWQKSLLSFKIDMGYKHQKHHDSQHLKRFAIGIGLHLEKFDILYHYLYYPHALLKAKQSQLGLIWRWPSIN
eukprot:COSAG01_NODE_7_length_54400_cov_1218.054935_32_plen_309_part_00